MLAKENSLNRLYSIEQENMFLNLFGYTTVGPDNGDRYNILDGFGNIVGFIQLKISKNSKNSIIYYTEINTPLIQMHHHRELGYQNTEYEFKLSEKNGNVVIKLDLSKENPYLFIESENSLENEMIGEKIIHLEFGIKEETCGNSFYIDFINSDNDFKTHERLSGSYNAIRNKNESIHYSKFTIDKDKSIMALNESFVTVFGIDRTYLEYDKKSYEKLLKDETSFNPNNTDITFEGQYVGDYFDGGMKRDKNSVLIIKKDLDEENCIVGIKKSLDENVTLEEKILSTPELFETFKRFQSLVNEVLPFKKDVFLEMIYNVSETNPILKLFLSSLKEKQESDIKRELLKKATQEL